MDLDRNTTGSMNPKPRIKARIIRNATMSICDPIARSQPQEINQ